MASATMAQGDVDSLPIPFLHSLFVFFYPLLWQSPRIIVVDFRTLLILEAMEICIPSYIIMCYLWEELDNFEGDLTVNTEM